MARIMTQMFWAMILSASLLASVAMGQSVSTFEGKPDFAEGTETAYFVWRDGDEWRVRWTTDGTMHRFNGSVMAEGGKLKSLKRIDVESQSKVISPGAPTRVIYGPRGRVVGVRNGSGPVVVNRTQDRIEKDGDHRIHFISNNDGDIDGFNFKVDKKVTSLKFAFEIDGKPSPLRIKVGKSSSKPLGDPFVVPLK